MFLGLYSSTVTLHTKIKPCEAIGIKMSYFMYIGSSEYKKGGGYKKI